MRCERVSQLTIHDSFLKKALVRFIPFCVLVGDEENPFRAAEAANATALEEDLSDAREQNSELKAEMAELATQNDLVQQRLAAAAEAAEVESSEQGSEEQMQVGEGDTQIAAGLTPEELAKKIYGA